jgi:glycosyltransferase involved in cell wall biosynthesis
MKLVIQIPCYNEAPHLPTTLSALPRSVPGFDIIEWLVVDDGSSDSTADVARRHGVHHVVTLPHNKGLAHAFMAGLTTALKAGADVIINTDADNQYDASCIPDLVQPILDGRAQIVIGARPIDAISHFSKVKKILQKLGSYAVRIVSGTNIPDAPSGFRAVHRDAAMRLNVFNSYTYTLETIIQAGRNNIPITSVPVRVNPDMRPSRLVKGNLNYVIRSLTTIIRIFVIYKPLRFFLLLSTATALPGLATISRFLYFYASGDGQGHIQSLVIAAALIACAAVLGIGGLLADLIAANRILLEDLRTKQLHSEVESGRPFQAVLDLIAKVDARAALSSPQLRTTQAGDSVHAESAEHRVSAHGRS